MYGLKNVLSTTTFSPRLCAISATAAMSVSDSVGFVGVSIHSSFVSLGRIRLSISAWMFGVKDTWTPCVSAILVKYLCVPPYTSETEMMWEPVGRDWRRTAVVELPEENAKAYFACSRDAMASSKRSLHDGKRWK